jgi:hypothetical protein
MKFMPSTSTHSSFQIIVLDHHLENDQRIIRHIDYCKKKRIPIHRVRINLHNYLTNRESVDNEQYSSVDPPLKLKGGVINYIIVYIFLLFSPSIYYQIYKKIRTITGSGKEGIIFHIHDPFLLIYGVVFKILLFKSSYIVFDRHEYYEKMRGLGKYCEKLTRFFIDGVILVTDNQINSTKSQIYNGINYIIIPNYPNFDHNHDGTIREKIGSVLKTEQIHLVYIGSLSTKVDRDIFGLLRIYESLLEKYPEIYSTVGGSTSEPAILTLFDSLTVRFPGRFQYTGYLSRDDVIKHILNAHLGFFLIDDTSPYWVSCNPNKVFDYLMYGVIPVIRANIDEHDTIKKCSLIFDRKDTYEKIIHDISYLVENRESLKALMEETRSCSAFFSFESVEDRYMDLYNEVLSTL